MPSRPNPNHDVSSSSRSSLSCSVSVRVGSRIWRMRCSTSGSLFSCGFPFLDYDLARLPRGPFMQLSSNLPSDLSRCMKDPFWPAAVAKGKIVALDASISPVPGSGTSLTRLRSWSYTCHSGSIEGITTAHRLPTVCVSCTYSVRKATRMLGNLVLWKKNELLAVQSYFSRTRGPQRGTLSSRCTDCLLAN